MAQRRLTAVKVWIEDIHRSSFIKRDDAPSSIVFSNGDEASRVNIIGIVVDMGDSLVIDDGTSSILVRSFDEAFNVSVGACTKIIGRVREFLGEKYIVGEIVKTIDPIWIQVRKKELPRNEAVNESKLIPTDNEQIVEVVRSLDNGDGAEFELVVAKLGKDGEETIVRLLAIGELFVTPALF